MYLNVILGVIKNVALDALENELNLKILAENDEIKIIKIPHITDSIIQFDFQLTGLHRKQFIKHWASEAIIVMACQLHGNICAAIVFC